jgi:iron complex outermembrane receptor protein/hemoglobin/transferrin/lactoferrin receptor protein
VVTTARPEEYVGRAGSRVERQEIEERQPRSSPDALRYEPGVYVQQTAHSQGSPYIRGRTGQQTVLLFDGIRLNNSLFRQGPNQYFFTVDSRVVHHIDVLRGSGSTRYGSDAIAGAILAWPLEPDFKPGVEGLRLRPTAWGRYASADGETGGRLQLEGQVGQELGFLGGFGYRKVGLLESGGEIKGLVGDTPPEVPRFEEDGRTQLGTGFKEWTGDMRLVWKPSSKVRATLGWYEYRQFDAPRTDKCPPPEAPFDECLKYDEQFRTLVLGRLDADLGPWARRSMLALSWQRQHERRTSERPQSFVINGGRDDVDSFGARALLVTDFADLVPDWSVRLHYGADLYHDRVDSVAWLIFTDLDITRSRTRGQYLKGSTYSWGGAFAEVENLLWEQVVLRAGARASYIQAEAPGDPDSGTLPVDQSWPALVGNVGLEWWVNDVFTLLANADQGFRAPNLDDTTSRQQTGPGFQYENANLAPERSLTLEVGGRARHPWFEVDVWAYRSGLEDAVARSPRTSDQCPNAACRNSRSQFQLVNLDGEAVIWGAEGSARLLLPAGVTLRGTISWAWGDGPNPADRPDDPSLDYDERVPLSRIPPLNGTVEAVWRHTSGAYLGGGLRWARDQDRLALADVSDARIPRGGTPGFSVLDLRAGWRLSPYGLLALVFENVTDEAYRYHGSSVNGPGRGLIAQLELSPF